MKPMRLLNISLSTPMAHKPDVRGPNDPQLHQIAYSRFFEKMIYVIKTPESPEYEPFDLTDKIRIVPSRSASRWSFLKHAAALGSRAIREQGATSSRPRNRSARAPRACFWPGASACPCASTMSTTP